MQLTFLGTSAGVPTRERNVSAVALHFPERAQTWLFDCGEGTQHQLLRSHLKISQIRRVLITHMHGDHVFGLPGLLATGQLAGGGGKISIYGPAGLAEYLRASREHPHEQNPSTVEVHTVNTGTILETDEFVVSARPLRHRIPAFGYRVTERDRPGRFRVEKAVVLGIPAGPLYGRLKRGERVTLPDRREIDPGELCEPAEPGRVVVYCTDTTYCEEAVELARDADVLIHEATFAESDAELARRSTHSTATMAARVARDAQAKLLVLTHLSPRYARGNPVEPDDLLREARAVFPNTELAHDFLSLEVPRRSAAM